jgi:hypothetical protein
VGPRANGEREEGRASTLAGSGTAVCQADLAVARDAERMPMVVADWGREKAGRLAAEFIRDLAHRLGETRDLEVCTSPSRLREDHRSQSRLRMFLGRTKRREPGWCLQGRFPSSE